MFVEESASCLAAFYEPNSLSCWKLNILTVWVCTH